MASQSFRRVGILVLAVVLSLACLVAIGFLGTAPELLSPSLPMATAQQTQPQLLAEPPSLPRIWSSALSPPLPAVKIYLDHHYLFCKQPLKLVPLKRVCDGHLDCLQGEDEANCPQWVPEGPPAGGECRTPTRGPGLGCCVLPVPKLTLCLLPARVSKDRSILQVLSSSTGAWSCVCHDHFTPTLARAACEQMGYSRYGLLPLLALPLPQKLLWSRALLICKAPRALL